MSDSQYGQTVSLGEFEGKDVIASTIAVTNAGDGLSEAMRTEPKLLHQGDTVHVVIECEVAKVRFQPVKGAEDHLERVHILRAGTATLIEAATVSDALKAQREANDRRREFEQGVARLRTGDELHAEHELGSHAGGREAGCPDCDAEEAAEEDEADEQ